MKKDDWLKEKLVERFDAFDSGLDLDQAWQELEERRNPKQKRRGFIYWILGIGFLGGLMFTFWNKDNSAASLSETIQVVEENREDLEFTNQKEILLIENTKEETVVVDESTERKNRIILKTQTQNTIGTQKKQNLELANTNLNERFSYLLNDINTGSIAATLNMTEANATTAKAKAEKEDIIIAETFAERNSVFQEKKIPIVIGNLGIQKVESLVFSGDKKENLVPPAIVRPLKISAGHSFGFNFAYGKHKRTMLAIGEDVTELIANRNLQESPLDAIELNIFYRKRMPWTSYLEFGIGFMQTSYLFEDQTQTVSYNLLEDQITEVHNFPDGTQENILGSIFEKETVTRDSKFYQNFRQLHLNTSLGKEIGINESTGLLFSAGLEYSLFSQIEGVSFANSEILSYGSLDKLGYKSEGVFAGLLGLGVYGRIGSANKIELSLAAKQSLNNYSKNTGFSESRSHVFAKLSFVRSIN